METVESIVSEIVADRNNDSAWKNLGFALEKSNYSLHKACRLISRFIMLKNLSETPNMLYACIIPNGDMPEELDGLHEWITVHNGKRKVRTITASEIQYHVENAIFGKGEKIVDVAVRCSNNYGATGVGVCGGVLELGGLGWIVVLFGGEVDADKSCGWLPTLPIGARGSIQFKEDRAEEFVNNCLVQLLGSHSLVL